MPLRVVGYAIISADGMIADADGKMPASIVNPADQRFYAEALDAAAVIVHGRNSHEQQANSPRRLRLIVTRQVAALAPHPTNSKAMLWNPNGASLDAACAALDVAAGTIAVVGGTDVFAQFWPRYEAFELTRAVRARIPNGRPVFPGIPPHTPEELLEQHGLRPSSAHVLDAEAEVTLTTWHR